MGKCGMFHNSVKLAVGVAKNRKETLLKVDFVANQACLANLLSFHTYKGGGGRLGKDVSQCKLHSSVAIVKHATPSHF